MGFQYQVLTVGALHQVDSAALRLAASAWHGELAVLPKPLLVVNVGGPTSNVLYLSCVSFLLLCEGIISLKFHHLYC